MSIAKRGLNFCSKLVPARLQMMSSSTPHLESDCSTAMFLGMLSSYDPPLATNAYYFLKQKRVGSDYGAPRWGLADRPWSGTWTNPPRLDVASQGHLGKPAAERRGRRQAGTEVRDMVTTSSLLGVMKGREGCCLQLKRGNPTHMDGYARASPLHPHTHP